MYEYQTEDTLEDAAIVSLFHSGRPERQHAALAALFDRYGAKVYSLAFHVAGDKTIAENVTVEVFFRFWRSSALWSTSERWSPTLLRLAYDLALATTPDSLPPPGKPDRNTAQPHAHSWLPQRVYDRLSHTELRVIELAYFLGFTCEEIAVVIGSTPSRVMRDLRVGMRRLRSATSLPERRNNTPDGKAIND